VSHRRKPVGRECVDDGEQEYAGRDRIQRLNRDALGQRCHEAVLNRRVLGKWCGKEPHLFDDVFLTGHNRKIIVTGLTHVALIRQRYQRAT
jgi:hypothetical protein